jgi:general secretion pathway protein E
LLVAPDALIDDAMPELTAAYGEPLEHAPADWVTVQQALATLGAPIGRHDASDEARADTRDLADQPPVIRFLNALIRTAVASRASDIHLEVTRENAVARLRVDGMLSPTLAPAPELRDAVVSRIKLLANMDIADRRAPQDGSFRVRLDHTMLDVRVSVVPTGHGESVVLRLLAALDRPASIEELGLPTDMLRRFRRALQRPSGLVIVTGPTGSGKTTTLYAALQTRDAAAEKIMTVEDPIEYDLPSVTQVAVASRGSVGFADALRSLLRQDPDVVLIGEVRDAETASIAVRAALTGHLVLTTLHTNDAASAIPRLQDLGVPTYLLRSTVQCVIAQRLVRRICADCRADRAPRDEERRALADAGFPTESVSCGVGCDACRGTGYRGRLALFEVLEIGADSEVSAAAERGDARSRTREGSMWQHGLLHVSQGTTSLAEVVRVTND